MCCVLAARRKEEHVALALMMARVMIMLPILVERVLEARFTTQDEP